MMFADAVKTVCSRGNTCGKPRRAVLYITKMRISRKAPDNNRGSYCLQSAEGMLPSW
jgi:hypothetical protein